MTDRARNRRVALFAAWGALAVLAVAVPCLLYGQGPGQPSGGGPRGPLGMPGIGTFLPGSSGPAPPSAPPPGVQMGSITPGQVSFDITIDPKTPLKDLLPAGPKAERSRRPVVSDDPAKVPELVFEPNTPKDTDHQAALKRVATTVARVNHVNKKGTDEFIKALRGHRPDLAGLPFAMGDDCRTKGEHSKLFARAVDLVHASMGGDGPEAGGIIGAQIAGIGQAGGGPGGPPGAGNPVPVIDVPGEPSPAAAFWERFRVNCDQEDAGIHRADKERRALVTTTRIAALMQILAPQAPSVRLGLVRYLAATSHVEATRALARLAIFSQEEDVRVAAIDALKVRRERDYTDTLTAGLSYPYPAVAKRAAEAIVKLERTDLVPRLIDVLDAADPRAPVVKDAGEKKVTVASELVRVNHHRSCLLCHAPGNTEEVGADALTAGVPVPTESLGGGGAAGGYRRNIPDILVRIDVTYLRQDFSAMLPVADANPWPEMQRFDFLVHTRELSDDEAAAYRKEFATDDATRPNPYRRAALAALRDLTGRDAAPTGEAWRKMLQK